VSLSAAEIQAVEVGSRGLAGRELLDLADALQVSTDDLLHGPSVVLYRDSKGTEKKSQLLRRADKIAEDYRYLKALLGA